MVRHARKVLVVDYDLWERRRLSAVLAGAGYVILEASNGVSGARLAEQYGPHVIVLAEGLPELRDDLVLEQLRSRQPTRNIPVLVIADSSSNEKEWKSHSVAGVLPHSIDPRLLLQSVAHAVLTGLALPRVDPLPKRRSHRSRGQPGVPRSASAVVPLR
jgi:CheY-like chemotaxis protein